MERLCDGGASKSLNDVSIGRQLGPLDSKSVRGQIKAPVGAFHERLGIAFDSGR